MTVCPRAGCQNRLSQLRAIDVLFNRFDTTLRNVGYLPMSGQILDATLVSAPKRHNTNAEKADMRAGQIYRAGRISRQGRFTRAVMRDEQ